MILCHQHSIQDVISMIIIQNFELDNKTNTDFFMYGVEKLSHALSVKGF